MHDTHLEDPCVSRQVPPASRRELGVRWVMIVTAAAMVIEIVVGSVTHSMALLADGWHMATHVGALAVASASYWVARRYATRNTFGFGTGKISALAGYTNALALGAVAIVMLIESVQRFSSAAPIDFATSLPVAVGGLAVNVLSIWILQDDHDEHDHHHHHDHNHRAVALHVVADAFTSALAIAALGIGYATGIQWLDALTGIVGACAIMHWVATLCRHTSCELLDLDPAGALQQEVRARLQQIDDVRVLDLHVWSIGRGQHGCVATLIASAPRTPDDYRQRVLAIPRVAHVTIEVRRCHGDHANEQAAA